MICDSCKDAFPDESMTEFEGEHYCEECLDDQAPQCDDCGKRESKEDMTEIKDGVFVCSKCAVDYHQCCGCHKWFHGNNCVWIDQEDKMYCEECADEHYPHCHECGDRELRSEMRRINGYLVCESCRADHWYTCNSCEEWVHADDIMSNDHGIYCSSCFENEEHSDYIREYGKTKVVRFYGDGPLYLGVELEIDGKSGDRDVAEKIVDDWSSKVECKEDGSLHEHSTGGIEIVTQPCSLKYHKESFNWEELLELCRDYGWRSHDTKTCGLHVHVTKSALSSCDQIKLAAFIHLNKERHEIFGRRKSGDYYKYKKVKGNIRDELYSSDRRCAVNYTNSRTVEFRFFKGTLKLSTLFATLEYCACLCEFVKKEPIPLFLSPSKCWKKFCDFAAEKEYKYLTEYMKEKDLILNIDESKIGEE